MKKKIIIIVFFILFAGGIVYILAVINRPSENRLTKEVRSQALSKILGRKAVLEVKPQQSWIQYTGKYVEFSYPQSAQIVPKETPTLKNVILEFFEFTISDPRTNFGYQVSNVQQLANIEEYSGIALRRAQPGTYHEIVVPQLEGTSGIGFVKTDSGYEKTAFYIIDKKVYTFSARGADSETVDSLFTHVFATIKRM